MQPRYTRTRIACYLGYVTQAIINNLAPLLFIIFQTDYGLSYEQVGRLILLNFGTQILSDFFAMRFADRIGYRVLTVAAHGFCTVGLVCLSLLPRVMPSPFLGLCVAVMLYAVGGGLIEVLISPIIEALPGEQKAASMSFLHSFYCWGQMLVVLATTLALWGLGRQAWPLLPVLWALVPFCNLFLFLGAPLVPLVPEGKRSMSLRQLLSARGFFFVLVLMATAGAAELTMSQWSSLFAEKGLGVGKLLGDLLGPCLFAVLMGSARLLYGIFGAKFALRRVLLCSGVLCVVCYLVASLSGQPLLSLIACAVCGVSVALMWPGTISLAAAAFPLGGTVMFGVLAVGGDVGASLGPWLAGWVSDALQHTQWLERLAAVRDIGLDQMGLKAGLLLGVAFPALFLAALLALRRSRMKTAKDSDSMRPPVASI